MKKRKIKIMLRHENAHLPKYATERSAGADVCTVEEIILAPGERTMVHTGIYMELPEDVEVQVRPRSGLALKRGITVLNSPGTIDSDYQGECNVILINHGDQMLQIPAGERIAQFVFTENVVQAEFEKVDDFSEQTERGDGGFGHSGMKA